jgi:hypothetical protein
MHLRRQSRDGVKNPYWMILLVPVAYCCLQVCFGPIGLVTKTFYGSMALLYRIYWIPPLLPPMFVYLAWLLRRRVSRVVLVVFVCGMGVVWVFDLWGLYMFTEWMR